MAASLLGVFGAAEGTAAVTTGSRTSVSGSLITVACGVWPGTGGGTSLAVPTDSNGNTYTELAEIDFNSAAGEDGWGSLSYNIGGTRGAAHTISEADNGGNSIGGQEWDGIETSPTIVTGTQAQGSSTAPSASVAITVPSLVILVFGYSGTATTFTTSDGTLAQELDENNDQQPVGVHYKAGQTSGTISITATLAASRTWGARCFSFSESSAGGTTLTPGLGSTPMTGRAFTIDRVASHQIVIG